tara:strand:- start:1166 stop:2026 length:861 start_codon:yes stop_codon:yes gene_type:complete
MPKRSRSKSAQLEQTFIEWLQTIGSMPYNGKTILSHYMQRSEGSDWEDMRARLRTAKADWWVFVRGKLSADEVQAAKTEYINKFVFICKEQPSEPYISALLGIEECQLRLRVTESAVIVTCPECRAKDIQIRALENQIRRMNEEVTMDARVELMREEFQRAYKHDPWGRLTRSDLRTHMEEFLKREINDHESLPASCPLWALFLRDIVRAPPQGTLRFSRRQTSIAGALMREEPRLSDTVAPLDRTRHRAIDGAGDAVPCLARHRHLGNHKKHRVSASASSFALDD